MMKKISWTLPGVVRNKKFFAGIFVFLSVWLVSPRIFASSYGYLLEKGPAFSVWWTEAPYKVMQDDPVPQKTLSPVMLKAAGNEYESFQIVVRPEKRIREFSLKAGNLTSTEGGVIDGTHIAVREVRYVHVVWPTDSLSAPGWYPDPLPPAAFPEELSEGENHPYFLTVYVPAGTRPGMYSGKVILSIDGQSVPVPVRLRVWSFTLPAVPTVRSSFGFNPERVALFHHVSAQEDKRRVTDRYFQAYRDYRIAPTNPFWLYPVKVRIKGLFWEGGTFDTETVYDGKMSMKVTDDDPQGEHPASCTALISVAGTGSSHWMKWAVKTATPDQRYTVLLQCYDKDRNPMIWENREKVFRGDTVWKEETFLPRPFRKEIAFVRISLFPVFRSKQGCETGTAWFDDLSFSAKDDVVNKVPQGDFEIPVEQLDLSVDFSDFDKAGERYLNDFGFNAFSLNVEGLPSGTFFHRKKGVFHGFAQGTPQYELLFNRYLRMIRDHLEEKGWLDKAYVYWFDEPSEKDYPFVKEGMELIRKAAPGLKRFLTEDSRPPDDLMQYLDINCPKISRVRPDEVKEMTQKGKEYWSYVCCCPTAPWLSEFIDHPAINMRMWLWISYRYGLKGILIWQTVYWNSTIASPKGVLQNPWENPMSYTDGYGKPYGIQLSWGNGDGRFFYPPNRDPNDGSGKILDFDPVPSLRLEILRDGIEDYEYLKMLGKAVSENRIKNKKQLKKARQLLDFPKEMFVSFTQYNKDPQYLLEYRKKIAELLNEVEVQ